MTDNPHVANGVHPISLPRVINELRRLCRPDTDGGAAINVRLADGDPLDHDPFPAVTVDDLHRALDKIAARCQPVTVIVDEATDLHLGTPGRGKTDADAIHTAMQALIFAGRKTDINSLPEYRPFVKQYPTLSALQRAIATGEAPDPWSYRVVRMNPPAKAAVHPPTGDVGAVAGFLAHVLPRRRGAATLADLRAEIADRAVGVPFTHHEFTAGLATLHAAGQVTVFDCYDGPRYLASRHEPDPADEPALAVLIAEYLDVAGTGGATVEEMTAHIEATYDLIGQGPLTPTRVTAAATFLTEVAMVVHPSRVSPYFAPRHVPS